MIIVCLSLFIHVSCTMCFNVRIWRFAIIAAQCRTGCQCQPSKFMGSPARSPALSLLGSRCPLTFASWCCSTSLDATTVLFVSHTDTACSGTTEWTGRIAVGGWWWVGLRLRTGQGLVCKGFLQWAWRIEFPVSLHPWVIEEYRASSHIQGRTLKCLVYLLTELWQGSFFWLYWCESITNW